MDRENPEDVPSGYMWLVGGTFFALATVVLLATFFPLAALTGVASWFCYYVGKTRSDRKKAALAAAAKETATV